MTLAFVLLLFALMLAFLAMLPGLKNHASFLNSLAVMFLCIFLMLGGKLGN
jgi:hypothetical protein